MDICLVEYKNYISSDCKPVGHGQKYIYEIAKLLDTYSVTIAAGKNYLLDSDYASIPLPFCCTSNYNGLKGKALNILRRIVNIMMILLKSKSDLIWFTNIDWTVFLVLGLFKVHKKIIITAYAEPEKILGKCPSILKRRAMRQIYLIVKTNQRLKYSDNDLFLPDFFYDNKYKNLSRNFEQKKDSILVIGTFREEKDMLGAVRCLNQIGKDALVCGRFYEEKTYNDCLKAAENNVCIQNRIIPEDEYLSLISEYKYIFLPYKDEYKGATSGVLLETIFVDSIPIAPSFLLSFNEIDGIGYTSTNEIADLIKIDRCKDILAHNEAKKNKYDVEEVYQSLKAKIEELDEVKN